MGHGCPLEDQKMSHQLQDYIYTLTDTILNWKDDNDSEFKFLLDTLEQLQSAIEKLDEEDQE